jgi:hypothetical protein
MKIWSPDLSATQIPPMCCRVYGEVEVCWGWRTSSGPSSGSRLQARVDDLEIGLANSLKGDK